MAHFSRISRDVHRLFELSLLAKGVFAFLEFFSGVLIYFVSAHYVASLIMEFTQEELPWDRHDIVAHQLRLIGHSFASGGHHFVGIYLILHGLIKLALIVALLRGMVWAYPVSLVMFMCFVAYQLYRFTHTGSVWLILLTIFDIFVMYLIWREYQIVKQSRNTHS